MKNRLAQIGIGWIVTLGLASIGAVFGYGQLVQSNSQVMASINKQDVMIEKLTEIQTNTLTILARQDERLKFLESRK